MKVVRVGFIAAAVLAMATLSFAQKPDFSGTWTLDEAASGTAGGGAADAAAAASAMVAPSSRLRTR